MVDRRRSNVPVPSWSRGMTPLWFPSSWPARSREENGVEMTEAERSSPRSTTSRCSAPVMAASATSLTVAFCGGLRHEYGPGRSPPCRSGGTVPWVGGGSSRRHGWSPSARVRRSRLPACGRRSVGAAAITSVPLLRRVPAGSGGAGRGSSGRARHLRRPQDWREGRGRPCRLPGHGGTPR